MKFIYNLKKTFQFKLIFIFFISNSIFVLASLSKQIHENEVFNNKNNNENIYKKSKGKIKFLEKYPIFLSEIRWRKINESKNQKNIDWKILTKKEASELEKLVNNAKTLNSRSKDRNLESDLNQNNFKSINSLNRSIVFNNKYVGPDISFLIPPGFAWNEKYKFDLSVRGHSRRKDGETFFSWNGGDAVSQNYFQFLNSEKYTFGLNYGIRSVYSGKGLGGSSSIGEGQSLGFRWDYKLSEKSGFAIGGEQIIHFDGLTDTGRDFYITASKAFSKNNNFPITIATGGIATGKMAEGNIKGLCSDLFGGSGTEIENQRSLCWAPVFSLSKVYNHNLSTFFEYNSKWFLLGTSISPFREIPLRGTFAITLSDHIDNYKLKNFDNMKWVFRLSLGF